MSRLACVDVAALPLQLLSQQHPEWQGCPMAVVADEKPQAKLLFVNEQAVRCGVKSGQRYAAALTLAKDLRAATVSAGVIRASVACLASELRKHTAELEASDEAPGVFWAGGSGLGPIYGTLGVWSRALSEAIQSAGFVGAVVVGFTRFGTWAAARVRPATVTLFPHLEAETRVAHGVPLARLGLDPSLRDILEKLGIRTVGDFVALPPQGVRERFGDAAWRLHRLASGDLRTPLQPQRVLEPLEQTLVLEPPESNVERLVFLIKQLLHPLLTAIHARRQAVTQLRLGLQLDDGKTHDERLGTAEPTLDVVLLMQLVRLRLERLQLSDAVTDLHLAIDGVPAPAQQLDFFAERPRRDLAAIGRAFDRLRAEFGDGAVMAAQLRDGHLPVASFAWKRLEKLPRPPHAGPAQNVLVRRIYPAPIPLPMVKQQGDDGWLLRGQEGGSVLHLWGPYRVAGGWWQHDVDREYYYAEMSRGELLWVFYDAHRRRWFLQGRVE